MYSEGNEPKICLLLGTCEVISKERSQLRWKSPPMKGDSEEDNDEGNEGEGIQAAARTWIHLGLDPYSGKDTSQVAEYGEQFLDFMNKNKFTY